MFYSTGPTEWTRNRIGKEEEETFVVENVEQNVDQNVEQNVEQNVRFKRFF